MTSDRILIIKLGALGDFVQALGPCAAIRARHPNASITLLTTAPFADFSKACPYFDDVWIDDRASWLNVRGWLGLRRRLREAAFSRVYDLQTSDRSNFYYRMMGPEPRPEWSGTARGCSHPDRNPERTRIHTIERQRSQLRDAGIDAVPLPDLSWVTADIVRFGALENRLLLVPGGAAHRPAKRWPAARYADLAKRAAEHGMTPVLIGAAAEKDIISSIVNMVPEAVDLSGRTDFADIVSLARGAFAAVGNDTGPMHLIAGAGCRSIVLFSNESDPERCAPRAPEGAPQAAILRRANLADLSVDEVWGVLEQNLDS